jgi:hypothetical protein
MDAEANFFKSSTRKSGYQGRCKKCWKLRNEAPEPESTPTLLTSEAGDRIYDYSHTRAEVDKIEQTSGIPFVGWAISSDMYVPVFSNRSVTWIDKRR